MKDRFGREISYLRLSVTDLCNLRCVYCMPECGVSKLRHEDILRIEEIEEIARAAAQLGVAKVRITGGEPLVRRGIIEICRRVSSVPGITETSLTTNGALLPRFSPELRDAGVKRLNISLDSLDAETYRRITRGGELPDALRGIEAALAAGFEEIKINCVLIGGVNDRELTAIAGLSRASGVHVRFIEMMPFGGAAGHAYGSFLPGASVLEAAPDLEPVGVDGVARLYAFPWAPGTVGLINAVTEPFCPGCNRIRVTADGMLKPCLHSADETSLRGLHGNGLIETMRAAIFGKPLRHHLDGFANSASERGMNAIGG